MLEAGPLHHHHHFSIAAPHSPQTPAVLGARASDEKWVPLRPSDFEKTSEIRSFIMGRLIMAVNFGSHVENGSNDRQRGVRL